MLSQTHSPPISTLGNIKFNKVFMDRLTISICGKTTVTLLPLSNDISGGNDNTHSGRRSDSSNVNMAR